jgi:WD40 repeat protein
MISGNIWKTLNAHSNEVTAICFDVTGNILVSYSSLELTVKYWKVKYKKLLIIFI